MAEDYTGYTEADPNNKFTVTTNNIDIAGLSRNEDAWIVDDKTVDHFDGDLEHLVDIEVTLMGANAAFWPWVLANSVDDWNALFSHASKDLLSVVVFNNLLRLQEVIGTSLIDDSYTYILNTPYYLKLKRDESVGSFGQLQCFIYSDIARTSLLDTLSLTLRAKKDFRYIYGVNAGRTGGGAVVSGSVSNLDLQEAAAGIVIFRRRIEGD